MAFHSPSCEDVHIRGWERAHMGGTVTDIAAAFLPENVENIRERLNPRHYLANGPLNPIHIRNAVAVGDNISRGGAVLLDHDGTELSSFTLQLNTALAVGSDPVCLFARLHAQCEIHCYVEGPNRTWLAGLIDDGLKSGLYRTGAGWTELGELLLHRDDEPVVTSYSVSEGFPDPHLGEGVPPAWVPTRIDEYGEAVWDDWYEVDKAEQWRLCMDNLRGRPEYLLELSPDNLRRRFGHSRSLIDLFATSPAEDKVSTP